MKRTLIFLLVLLLSFAALAQTGKDIPTLVTSGTGSVQVEPDTATVRLEVEVVKPTAEQAQAENARIMGVVMSAIEKQGIAKAKIQTSGFNVYPERQYNKNRPPKITGYRCANQVVVTIEDLKKISRIIDIGIASGVNNIRGLQFTRKDDQEARKMALGLAVKEAQAKASAIAAASGVKLKNIQSILEGTAPSPLPMDNLALRAMSTGAPETPVSPGLIEIRANVTLVYRIE